ncbi:MAG: gliding motility-associated C-terminal domain-containing protein, partial [Salibacteraceae bacterium]
YMAVISPDGNNLEFGTFYGGNLTQDHVDGGTSRFDRAGQIYHSVCASCGGFNDFPIAPSPGAHSPQNNSNNCNNAVFKIDFQLPIVVADFNIPPFACAPYTLNIQNNSVTQNNTTFFWDFGNGQTSTVGNPSITFTEKGNYSITLIVDDPTSCNLKDTLIRNINIALDTNYRLPEIERCIGDEATLGPDPIDYQNLTGASISWQPSGPLSNPNSLNPTVQVTQNTTFRLVIDYGGCQERILQDIVVDEYPISTGNDTIICSNYDPFVITGTAFGQADTFEWSDDPDFQSILSNDSTLLIDQLDNALNYFYFRTTKESGCKMVDTILVTISDEDIELSVDSTICKNDSFRVKATSNNPLNTFVYIWTKNEYSDNPSESISDIYTNYIDLFGDTAQSYYLTAISQNDSGCIARDFVQFSISALDRRTVNAIAVPDSFYRGQTIELRGEPTNGNISTSWSPEATIQDPQNANTLAQPEGTTDYIWTVTDNETPECVFSDTVRVSPYEILCDTPEIYIPTAFSPNGDGLNDELRVYGKNVESMLLIIHDRWGNEVFRSEDQSIGWDGTYKGEQADRAVYVFQLEVTCPTKDQYKTKGNITKLH